MQQARNITRHMDYNQLAQVEVKQVGPDAKKIAIQLINGLFKELAGCCTAWAYTFSDDDKIKAAKLQWVKTFIEQGITSDQQINIGMARVRKNGSAYVPTPGEFVKYCKPQPEDFGLPGPELAYREACSYSHDLAIAKWTHQAVYEAAKATGWFELKTLEERQALPLFKRNYEIITRRVMAGEPLSDIPKALPGEVLKTPAEKNEAYHDSQQQDSIRKAGLNQLRNRQTAMAAIKGMLV